MGKALEVDDFDVGRASRRGECRLCDGFERTGFGMQWGVVEKHTQAWPELGEGADHVRFVEVVSEDIDADGRGGGALSQKIEQHLPCLPTEPLIRRLRRLGGESDVFLSRLDRRVM